VRGFAFLWTALLTNGFATQMIVVAIGWQVYTIRHRPLDLGYVGLAQFLPAVFLTLPAGHAADRFDRRRVVLLCHLCFGVCAALLAPTRVPALDLALLGVGFLNGIASAIGTPAQRALTPELVPTELLQGAIAARSVAGQIGLVAGLALGGVIFAIEPLAARYAIAGALSSERAPPRSASRGRLRQRRGGHRPGQPSSPASASSDRSASCSGDPA
jgi:MFS family permease